MRLVHAPRYREVVLTSLDRDLSNSLLVPTRYREVVLTSLHLRFDLLCSAYNDTSLDNRYRWTIGRG
jgi:hypothetical protein